MSVAWAAVRAMAGDCGGLVVKCKKIKGDVKGALGCEWDKRMV